MKYSKKNAIELSKIERRENFVIFDIKYSNLKILKYLILVQLNIHPTLNFNQIYSISSSNIFLSGQSHHNLNFLLSLLPYIFFYSYSPFTYYPFSFYFFKRKKKEKVFFHSHPPFPLFLLPFSILPLK